MGRFDAFLHLFINKLRKKKLLIRKQIHLLTYIFLFKKTSWCFFFYLGSSVRNIQAFLVLQYVFLKSNSASLCCTILDAISSVYHADNANYFILENQHTLPQFCEKIHLKPTEIQVS